MNRTALLVTLLAMLIAGQALAMQPIGARAGLSSSPDQIFVGGQMYLTELSPNLWLVPKVDAGFGDNFTFIYVFGTVLYSFVDTDMGGFTPYAGGGLGLTFWSWDTEIEWLEASGSDFGITGIAGMKKMLASGNEFGFELELGLSDYTADFKAAAFMNFF